MSKISTEKNLKIRPCFWVRALLNANKHHKKSIGPGFLGSEEQHVHVLENSRMKLLSPTGTQIKETFQDSNPTLEELKISERLSTTTTKGQEPKLWIQVSWFWM